jgi:hypothetical protein
MIALYQLAVATKRSLLQSQPGSIASASVLQQPVHDPLRDFKPKSSEGYLAHLEGRVLTKSRRHEQLVDQYGTWVATRGFRPSTKEHPKDLVLRRDSLEWLVEAKVLYQGNATEAVRAALGQLYAYRFFLCKDIEPRLVALFSEPIGHGYVQFLRPVGSPAYGRTRLVGRDPSRQPLTGSLSRSGASRHGLMWEWRRSRKLVF